MLKRLWYLVATIGWTTGRVLSWRLSNTHTAGVGVEALVKALTVCPKPGIINTDQGSRFTGEEFTKVLWDHGVEIRLDGRRCCRDEIFTERLRWTWMYARVYPRPAANGIEQTPSLTQFFNWYNSRRPHHALGWQPPDESQFGMIATTAAEGADADCRPDRA